MLARPGEAATGERQARLGKRGPIRVAHLLHTMAHGGVETAILNWNRTFDPDRVQSHLICFANPGQTEKPFVTAAATAGFAVETIRWSRWKPVFTAARKLAAYLRQERIEVLHCHNTYANAVGLIAAKLVPVRTITTMYVWGNFGFKRGLLQSIDAFLMKRFHQVSAHCESCFHDTVARGIPKERLALLICGYPATQSKVNEQDRQRLRREMKIGPETFVIIYMARFWPEKAHDNLLKAFETILERCPNCRLWLPGVGPELERIQALAAEMNLSHAVDFLGFRSDPEELLAMADMQVHPSDNEGVALAVCAGMSAGKPMVATDVGGLPEVLKHDVNSILVRPRDPAALANAVVDLIADPERAAKLGREARRFVLEEYSLAIATKRVEHTYESMLAG